MIQHERRGAHPCPPGAVAMNAFGGRFFEEILAGTMVFTVVLPFVLLALAIPYAVLYLRDSRNEEHDPEIGLKATAYFMFSLSILLVLSGLTVIVIVYVLDQTADGNY